MWDSKPRHKAQLEREFGKILGPFNSNLEFSNIP